ncbi:MAG TPA: TRAP transporter permease DctQ [Rhodobacteraceae bacterium]|nr:TRAP transporter permease DctQ [Paracoccaceae bacterium]
MGEGKPALRFEETLIAALMGGMVTITFINVVLRKLFNSSLIWGLEVTLILFAWLVIFGISYGVKKTIHLGVDALTTQLSSGPKRAVALFAAAVCLVYGGLMMKGAWDYWAPFAGLYPTEGRWFPLGFDETARDRAFYVTDQVPMPGVLRFLEDWINYGEAYDKLPRVIPYAILPVGIALFLLRLIQATWRVVTGRQETMIVSHEVEDELDALKKKDA